jgi:hypothetical protein
MSLKNLIIKAPGLFSTRENTSVPEEFEVITEAMAERLAERVPKLLKGLEALQKKTRASQHHKTELQKWVDKENEELLNLKETISERKRSHLKSLSENARSTLVKRHPVWASNFNLYFDQIQDLFAIHKDERTIVQCILETHTFKSIKIFYYASGENLLCINSLKNLKYDDSEMLRPSRTYVQNDNSDGHPLGEYIFRPIPGGQAQWTFTGNRWGVENHILWLDFGKNKHE